MIAQMTAKLARRVATLGANNRAGAIVVAGEAVRILRDAHREDASVVVAVAVALCSAQPAMAPVWNAAALALRADGNDALTRYGLHLQRAPAALARVTADVLLAGGTAGLLFSVVTVSASRSVHRCLSLLSRRCRLHVLCAEGRPLFEGRELSAALAGEGIATTICTDAAVTSLSQHANAVLVGADAVAADWFLNKCGTRQVLEVAASQGVPAYAVASRDKFVHPRLANMLEASGGDDAEVWEQHPPAVTVANPYFERVPTDSLSGIATDVGLVGPSSLGDVADSLVTAKDAGRLVSVLQKT